MYDHDHLVRTLSDLTSDLVQSPDVPSVLESLAHRVTSLLHLEGCGVSLAAGGRLQFGAAVPISLVGLEQIQDATQQGPCVEAHRTGRVVALDDVDTAPEQWGGYARAAGRHGLRAVAGVPMRLHQESVGALDLYDATPRAWAADELAVARALAAMVAAHIVNDAKLRRQQELTDQLTRALSSRVRIEQAKGVLAEAEGITVDEAFHRLRSWARSHNEVIADVADRVVHSGLRP